MFRIKFRLQIYLLIDFSAIRDLLTLLKYFYGYLPAYTSFTLYCG